MELSLSYDAQVRAWVFDNARLVIENRRDLERLDVELARVFERMGPTKMDFLVSVDGMRLAPELAGAYGAIAKVHIARRCRHVVRYGVDLRAIVGMRSAAMRNGFASAIAPTRADAIRALEKMRTSSSSPRLALVAAVRE